MSDGPGPRGGPGPRRAGWPARSAYPQGVLLSDKDIRAEIDAGRVRIDPYDESMVQPSSIDVRLDRYLPGVREPPLPAHRPRGRAGRSDPAVEPEGDEAFILHPGEFVLASTYEVITLPDDLASRLEGKSSLGRLGLLTHSTAGFIDPGFSGHVTLELSQRRDAADQALAGHEDRPAVHVPAQLAGRVPVRQRALRLPLPGAARADRLPVLPELPPDPGVRGGTVRET